MQAASVVVLVTCPSKEEAEKIAQHIVNEKLAACVNIVPGLTSYFWWEGKVEKSSEVLLVVKSKLNLIEELISEIRKNHSYTVPEIIALPILAGNKDYLEWLDKSVKQ